MNTPTSNPKATAPPSQTDSRELTDLQARYDQLKAQVENSVWSFVPVAYRADAIARYDSVKIFGGLTRQEAAAAALEQYKWDKECGRV